MPSLLLAAVPHIAVQTLVDQRLDQGLPSRSRCLRSAEFAAPVL